jgi:hypothetical protein
VDGSCGIDCRHWRDVRSSLRFSVSTSVTVSVAVCDSRLRGLQSRASAGSFVCGFSVGQIFEAPAENGICASNVREVVEGLLVAMQCDRGASTTALLLKRGRASADDFHRVKRTWRF